MCLSHSVKLSIADGRMLKKNTQISPPTLWEHNASYKMFWGWHKNIWFVWRLPKFDYFEMPIIVHLRTQKYPLPEGPLPHFLKELLKKRVDTTIFWRKQSGKSWNSGSISNSFRQISSLDIIFPGEDRSMSSIIFVNFIFI